jgi:hypothetical protein
MFVASEPDSMLYHAVDDDGQEETRRRTNRQYVHFGRV